MSDGSRASSAPPEAGTGGTNGNRGISRARSGLLARIALGVGGLAAGLQIRREIDAYLRDFSLPLVLFLERNPVVARPVAASKTGSSKVQSIRRRFASFLANEEALGAARDDRARTTARNALVVGLIALGGALCFLLAAATY